MPDPLASMRYSVCGIPFTPGHKSRVLLTLNEPDVGPAFYDGFGGPLLHPLTDEEACRKTAAEYLAAAVGVVTRPEQWCEIVTLRGDEWEVGFFYIVDSKLADAKGISPTDVISHERPLDLPLNLMPTLRWLIPLVLDDNVVKPLGMSGIKLLKE